MAKECGVRVFKAFAPDDPAMHSATIRRVCVMGFTCSYGSNDCPNGFPSIGQSFPPFDPIERIDEINTTGNGALQHMDRAERDTRRNCKGPR